MAAKARASNLSQNVTRAQTLCHVEVTKATIWHLVKSPHKIASMKIANY